MRVITLLLACCCTLTVSSVRAQQETAASYAVHAAALSATMTYCRTMSALTYSFQSAKDMLEKLRREHQRLQTEVTGDNFFNFVATGYHLAEWVERDPSIPGPAKSDLASVRAGTCIATCRDLTNASKHFRLNSNYQNQVTSNAKSERGFGVGRYGMGGYGGGEESITIELLDGRTFNALEMSDEVLQEWEAFFNRHAL